MATTAELRQARPVPVQYSAADQRRHSQLIARTDRLDRTLELELTYCRLCCASRARITFARRIEQLPASTGALGVLRLNQVEYHFTSRSTGWPRPVHSALALARAHSSVAEAMASSLLNAIRQLWCKQIDLPFDISKLHLEPDKTLNVHLEETFCEIERLHPNDTQLLECLGEAYKGSQSLLEIAPLYNYGPHHQANGYHTFVSVVVKFGKAVVVTSNEPGFSRQHVMHVFQILNTGLGICHKIHNKEHYGTSGAEEDRLVVLGVDLVDEESLFASKLDILDLLALMASLKTNLTILYANFNSCWLCPSISRVMQYFSAFMAIYSSHWRSLKFYNWTNRHNRGIMFANMSLNVNIDCLQSMWNLTEYRLARSFMSLHHNYLQWSTYSKSIYIPRQGRWKVGLFEPKVHDQNATLVGPQGAKQAKSSVRCLLMRSRKTNYENKSLLIHIHGGGFISQSPEFHQVYLNEWLEKLSGATILSIDYSLSPDSPYPEALQEVLDVYLWLISGEPHVERSLGFQPSKIALCGDSAGGNLCMALALALNDIRQSVTQVGKLGPEYRLPRAICCYYTPFLLSTSVSPSRLITSIDGLMPVGALLSCIAAYVPSAVLTDPDGVKSTDQATAHSNDAKWQLYPSNGFFQLISGLYSKITSDISGTLKTLLHTSSNVSSIMKRDVPWYKKSETVKQSLYNLNRFTSNPFISPLLAKDMQSLCEIDLFLYPLKYDPFLDDSIEMAKKWKGKVYIEVIDGLPHGFLNLIKFSAKAKEASDKLAQHLCNVLQ